MMYAGREQRRGFTLIELLVVISIISMLSSVVAASVSQARQKAVDVKKTAVARDIVIALSSYYSDHGEYPPAPYAYIHSTDSNFLTPLVTEKYLPYIPTDPINTPPDIFEYSTFHDASGKPRQYAYVGYYTYNKNPVCPFGLGVSTSQPRGHCHVVIPVTHPNCGYGVDSGDCNPYLD